jgi:hypothetical protein
MPENLRKDFLLIPGQEVTGQRHVHTTAMNTKKLIPWGYSHKERHRVVQRQVDDTIAVNGVTILNHPNYRNELIPEEVFPVKKLYMFELFNNLWKYDRKFKDDDPMHPTEVVWWDRMLTKGMIMYGVSSDDAHQFKEKKISLRGSNPGRGWVMVRSKALTPDAVTAAMFAGDFYASTGVYLSRYEVEDGVISLEIDKEETAKEMQKDIVREGKKFTKADTGYKIDLIGENGKVLDTVYGTEAEFKISKDQSYYRVKVEYIQNHPERGLEGFYAWCQPVFTDGRDKKKELPHKYLHSH